MRESGSLEDEVDGAGRWASTLPWDTRQKTRVAAARVAIGRCRDRIKRLKQSTIGFDSTVEFKRAGEG